MANVVVHNGVISFAPPTDGALVTAPAPFETTIPVSSSSNLKGESKAAALSSDVMAVILAVTAYTYPPLFTIPGTGLVTITGITGGISTLVTKDIFGVILDTATGTYVLTPTPGAGAQIPIILTFDSTPHPGTWSIGSANQTKLTSTG